MTVHISPLPDTAPGLPDTAPGAGTPEGGLGALSTDRGNLPLDAVDVRATVTGLVAGIEVVQGFRNPFDVPLEATYIFPLPDRAAVTAMRMEAADRVIEGTLKERGQARQDYDAAIAAGQRAAIAEEDRPDVFTMRVGNILPGERVTIRLTLNQPLPYEDGEATFRLPLVVAPRYVPGTPLHDDAAGAGVSPDTDAVPDASRISPPVLLPGFPNPVRLSVAVDLDPGGFTLTGVRSALHVVAEDEGDAGRTTVRLRPGERLDRDFILRLAYDAPETGALTLAPDTALTPDTDGGSEGTFTLTLLPQGQSTSRPRDIVLLLDRSGSMGGWKMIAARRAAGRIVDTFTTADRFAVVSFDDRIERPRGLDGGLATGTDRNRFRAVEHLAGLDARGGTAMLAPLEEACELLRDSGRDRVLVLITDGQVGNEDQILERLAPRLRGVRVHTVGIDRAVNAGFLNRLAGLGQGRCELVESEDRLDEAMELVHHRIGAPLVTGLSVEPTGGLELVPGSVAPRRIGALFPGVPLVVSGRFRGAPAGGLLVRGTAPDGTAWERATSGTRVQAPAAAAIWARAHVRDLEDRYAVAPEHALEGRIVDTSLRFGVLCRFTAFVAVDSRVVAEGGRPHQVTQPVEQPQGWEQPTFGAAAQPMAAPGGFAAAMESGGPPMPAPPPAAPSAPAARSRSRGMPRRMAQTSLGGEHPVDSAAVPDDLDLPDFLKDGAARPAPFDGGPHPHEVFAEAFSTLGLYRAEPIQARRDKLKEVRQTLEDALEVLRRTPGQDDAELSALLHDLGAYFYGPPRPAGPEDDAAFEALWDRTIATLARFRTTPPQRPGPAPRRAFWKRGR